MARSKRDQEPKRIAIAIELDEPYPHHHACYRGIQRYADEREDWECVVDPYIVGMTGEAGAAEYSGIVGRISGQAAAKAEACGIPMANLWMNSPVKDAPTVLPDYREAGRLAGAHLVARGFRRFGYMGVTRDVVGPLELAGFEDAIKEAGFSAPMKFRVPRNFEKSVNAFARFRKQAHEWVAKLAPPVGVFVPNDVMGRYLVRICKELNLRVPHDVGVVAQYNVEIACLGTEPTLSSVENDFDGVGYRAATLLDKLMKRKNAKPPKKPILIKPKRLIARASSDAFVVDDPIVAKALRFISDHSRDAITVMEVAKHLNTTTRTLARRFEQFLGRPVYSEISRLRVEYIKRQLLETDAPLGVLASEYGFSSTSHFTLFFRKATGVSPGEYRKQHRK